MKPVHYLVCLAFLLGYSLNTTAQRRPDWVEATPVYKDGACFLFFVGYGNAINKGEAYRSAEDDAFRKMANHLGERMPSQERVKIIESIASKRGLTVTEKINEVVHTSIGQFREGKPLQQSKYFEKTHPGYDCQILYLLETCPGTHLPDDAFPRRKAGLRAVVPSLGQFYKQQPLKGSLILGGIALIAAGSGVALSNENYYQKQANLYNTNATQFSHYIQQRDDWQNTKTGVLIIGGGLLFAYNVIDAIAKKGPRDYSKSYVSKPHAYWNRLDLKSYGAMNHAGLTLSYALP